MEVVRSLKNYTGDKRGCVLTIGNFDGFHRGHQLIIEKARSLAIQESLELAVMTFDPSPSMALRPEHAAKLLSPLDMKIQLLRAHGVDKLLVIEPTPEFLNLRPREFVENILVNTINIRHIVEGQTFNFGKRGQGTIISLQGFSKQFNFETHLTPSFTAELDKGANEAVCSTLIRHLVTTNQFEKVRFCLARDFILVGRIVVGRGKGRHIGYPTANLQPYCPNQLIPEEGVFAGWAQWGDNFNDAWFSRRRLPAAISAGYCETFKAGKWQIEAFLLGYNSDEPSLVDKHIILGFVEKIRDQQKFSHPDELKEIIRKDCCYVEKVIKI